MLPVKILAGTAEGDCVYDRSSNRVSRHTASSAWQLLAAREGRGLHQQNRKVPTLKGRQYKVIQILGSKLEQYKIDPNLAASLYPHSRW